MTSPVFHFKRGPKGARKPRSNPEHALQVEIVRFLKYTLPPDVLFTASLAGAYLGPAQRAKMSAAGLARGWPDLQFIIRRRTFYIELKAPIAVVSRTPERYGTLDDPDLSDDQVMVLSALNPEAWAICRSVAEVEAVMGRWGVRLRPYVWA